MLRTSAKARSVHQRAGMETIGPSEFQSIYDFTMKNQHLSRDEVLKGLQPFGGQNGLDAAVDYAKREIASIDRKVNYQTGLVSWLESAPFVLQANECSRAHKLLEAISADPERSRTAGIVKTSTPFVVRHDWLATMGDDVVSDYAGTVKLPYEACLFEFKVNGRYAMVLALQKEGEDPKAQPFLQVGEEWYAGGEEDCGPNTAFNYLWQQVVAICAVLDAEVATHNVQRAPHALNVKREKAGKLPLMDFHIIDLSKRSRASVAAGSGASGGHKRLHFRRGHWRHFEASKTWVRWCLVGNPDLGFIAKEYRL